ncbi:F-box/LRR-repeat protein 18-like isoform X2 [Panulirus ornatus]|uniref:F-box/LRR-repeat protein 18-like isoform X2 n=1 Tax=Panulirus ornatus TaxID=150431 RepID=UPI003A86842F
MEVNIEFLPDEIIVRILHFLCDEDLLSVASVSNRFSNIVCVRQVIRDLDLRRTYRYSTEDFKTFFLPRARCRNIQRINLDHVYWIRLPSFVVKLKNVETLRMIGTPLTFLQLKWILTSCPKLQDLSISWPDDMESDKQEQWIGGFNEVKGVLSRLQTLWILIYADPVPLLELLNHCTGLKKLIITNHHACMFLNIPRSFSGKKYKMSFPHLQELIIDLADGCFPLYLLGCLFQSILEGCQISADWKTYWANMLIYVNSESLEVWEMLRETGSLHHLQELLVNGQAPRTINLTTIVCSCPNLRSLNIVRGLNITLDVKKVCEALPHLQRLSICCQPEQGPPKIIEGIATLRYLTHLTVPVCALIEIQHNKETSMKKSDALISIGFKRKRVGVSSANSLARAELAAFSLVFENCPLIIMLEIGFNTRVSCSPARVHWECLENIKKLKRLTHLTLDGIPITDGIFLIEITKGCSELEFLRLRHLGPYGKCCYLEHLPQALTFCKKLVNLRIEQNYLAPGTAIFKALLECEKLERLFMHSERDMEGLDISAIDDFIEKQKSLVFVFIVGSHTPIYKCAKLARKYKKSFRPALIVRVRNALCDVFTDQNTETRTTPACHYNEMITFRSWTVESFM